MEMNSKPKGFTLIELLISLALFSLIGIATVQQIQHISSTKRVALDDLDQYAATRTAMSVMRNDLQQAFHKLYSDFDPDTQNLIAQNIAVAHTLFDGRKDQIVFTTLSHRVYYADQRECEQAEVAFYLYQKDGHELRSLMKRESPFIDEKLFEGGSNYTLVDSVRSLKFLYWDRQQAKWVEDWDSDGGNSRDRFPLAVRLEMVVADGNRDLSIRNEFKLANPNNEEYVVQF